MLGNVSMHLSFESIRHKKHETHVSHPCQNELQCRKHPHTHTNTCTHRSAFVDSRSEVSLLTSSPSISNIWPQISPKHTHARTDAMKNHTRTNKNTHTHMHTHARTHTCKVLGTARIYSRVFAVDPKPCFSSEVCMCISCGWRPMWASTACKMWICASPPYLQPNVAFWRQYLRSNVGIVAAQMHRS